MKRKIHEAKLVNNDFRKKVSSSLLRFRFFVAIFLDVVDFFIGWIPIINTLWDLITFATLSLILSNSKSALLTLAELPFIGVPGLAQIDQYLPIATAAVIIDYFMSKN